MQIRKNFHEKGYAKKMIEQIEEQCSFNANNKRCRLIKCKDCRLSDKYFEIAGIRLEDLETFNI